MIAQFSAAALAVATATFDGLWEGTLIVGAVWLLLRCAPGLGAATRYALWFCALVALAVIPLLTVTLQHHGTAAGAPIEATRGVAVPSVAAEPAATSPFVAPSARNAGDATVTTAAADPADGTAQIAIPQAAALAAAILWTLLCIAKVLRLCINLRQLSILRRDARPCWVAHGFPVFRSDRVHGPIATGFCRPAVILPSAIVERLTPKELEAIVLHEVAHLQRHDVWTNAVARVTEALVSLNPAAWFVMRRLSMEREIACDDWVVSRTGAGDTFARTLFAIAGERWTRGPVAAPSAWGSRHSIAVRIERLLDARPRQLSLSLRAVSGTLALIAFVVQSVSPVLAYTAPASGEPQVPGSSIAAGCPTPNRGIAMIWNLRRPGRADLRQEIPLPRAQDLAAHYGESKVAMFDVTVDATGKLRRVIALSNAISPRINAALVRRLLADSYEPALRNCVPVAATLRTGRVVTAWITPEETTGSVIVPVYPSGWAAAHPAACKIPTVTHARFRPGLVAGTAYTAMLPEFPAALENVPIGTRATTSLDVHVNAAGAATSAAVTSASGYAAFDEAALRAARRATYPLTPSNCTPLPGEYVWHATFARDTALSRSESRSR